MTLEGVIVGAAESPYRRRDPSVTTRDVLADAVARALESAGVAPSEVDGLGVSSFSLAPDHAVDLAWRLGLRLRWLLEDTNGGGSGINMLGHARSGIATGDASIVVLVAGDAIGPDGAAKLSKNFNAVTRDNLAPLGYQGPNALFAMLTQRQMQEHGLIKEDYGRIAIAQRAWAGRNPGAVYREPLTMEAYLEAPVVADPLGLYDCVPPVIGADAIVLAVRERVPADIVPIGIRAIRRTVNYEPQEGTGLTTGLAHAADELWEEARVAPADMDAAYVYDDYPSMVLAQLGDLGFASTGLPQLTHDIADGRVIVNTSGGLLSAGQAGSAGGSHGLVEATLQLQGRASGRQLPDARRVVVTGYGMVVYRFAVVSSAVVLERQG